MTTFLKNIFARNKLKKFVAILISAALWFFVMGSQDPPMDGEFKVPVSLINSSREFRATAEDKIIEVQLKAPRSVFAEFDEQDIAARIDVANLTEGEYDLPIEATFPKGFDLIEINPKTLHVKIEPYIEKQIAAEIIVSGSNISDSVVKGITKSLENLTVIGAKSEVEKVQRVIGYVGLNDENKADFDLQVPMSAIDADGREVKKVRVVPSAITVSVDLETGIIKKTVPVSADITLPNGKEFSKITVEPENIEIAGKEEILNSITEIKTAPLTLPSVQNTFQGTLKIILPSEVTSSTEKVTVTAELKQ